MPKNHQPLSWLVIFYCGDSNRSKCGADERRRRGLDRAAHWLNRIPHPLPVEHPGICCEYRGVLVFWAYELEKLWFQFRCFPYCFPYALTARIECSIYFGIVMVRTIWSSVSRRSEMAGIPEDWILARDWLRLFKKTRMLGFGGVVRLPERSCSI